MTATLLGFKKLDFTSNDKSQIKGTQFFIAFSDDGVTGQRTDKLFLRDDFPLPDVKPGNVIEITYNRHGKAENIRVVNNSKQINISTQ